MRLSHQVHFPTIALGALWIIHSLATTMYVPWQNSRQRESLRTFLQSIDTALRIQENLSELQTQPDLSRPAQQRLKEELLKDANSLAQQPLEPKSREVIQEVSTQLQNWEPGKQAPSQALDFYELTEECRSFISAQQRHLLLVIDQRSRTDLDVMIVRAILLVLGLMVGIGLAMWMARGLKQSLAQINVTLRDAAGETSTELGKIEVSSQGPAEQLSVLENQVQHVISNLHRVAEELQQARSEVVRAERLAAVGEVAAGVAHEIRNPLTSVKLLIQRAAEREPVHSLSDRQMQVLLEEISRMENTVQRLLDFARPEEPQNISCDLTMILDKSLALLEGRLQQQHIRLEVSDDHAFRPLLCDPRLIQQVIVNIVINAIDFMPSGGVLKLRQWNHAPTDSTVLEIQDSGPGIDPAVLERIFEPFVTSRSTGSGLGLAISRRVIEQQGGTLTATNVAEGGALFRIQLPLSTHAVNSAAITHLPLSQAREPVANLNGKIRNG